MTSWNANASRTRRSIREAADERSVDMNEPTDPPPGPDSTPPVIAVGTAGLSPVQQAWSDYVGHATRCSLCRSTGAGKCEEAERLHHAYSQCGKQAYERLTGETS
ncbi:hypothetical protein [Streptomyces scabiei]|uniref:hypothetical protein n=1 Tax=Streptomyces scabiei TaxID=1930 RepID=UPI00131ED0AA|nr:hypothetical protein [Streptomyces scabiei]